MSQRCGLSLLAAVITAGVLPSSAAGQPAHSPGPRTPWGDPDLQGIWTSATYTPLERPETLAERAFLTEEEVAGLAALVAQEGVDPLRARGILAASEEEREAVTRQTQENIHYDNAVWLTEEARKTFSSRRTSLIVDPPNGRIPPRVPEAVDREAARRRASRHLVYNIDEPSYDDYHTRTLQERCLVWRHEGPPMVPPSYNDMLQIFQTPDHVVVMQEMSNNDARIIPLDGRPHLPSRIRQWPGSSRGRWEGDTLVVDTTNFNEKTHYEGSTEALHVVERFTRVDAETIRYEFTVQDDKTWAQPWSAEFPLMKRDGPLYEYACHEGNHDLRHILEVARNVERQAAERTQDGAEGQANSR